MPAERIYVENLVANMPIDGIFLVAQKDLRTTKSGDYYISCMLQDRTGKLSGRLWQATESIFQSIPLEGFLHVKGRTEDYRGQLQLVIDACRPIPPEKVDLAEFLPTTGRDVEQMWSELVEILRSIRNKHLRLLIKKFLEDRELVAAYKRSPAAMAMHHPFIGGLLEHTWGIARAAQAILPLYPKINADLVLAGIFLHDIGKTAELSSGTAVNYTQRGMLVGHITMAAIWIHDKVRAVEEESGEPFPQTTLDLLQHLVLSHHGVHEYGSPKLPAIPEAFVLHYLDNLDAKVWMTLNAIATDPDGESDFTAYQRPLDTRLFKGSEELQ
ncbi:MAG: 3'-5' exoribonuclease YhaM family protein [Phycisphaerae bacterium]